MGARVLGFLLLGFSFLQSQSYASDFRNPLRQIQESCSTFYAQFFRRWLSTDPGSSPLSAAQNFSELSLSVPLGEGAFNRAYLVFAKEEGAKPMALILNQYLDPRNARLLRLKAEEVQQLKALGPDRVKSAKPTSWRHSTEDNIAGNAAFHIAWMKRENEYLKSLQGLQFQGRDIAPKFYRPVVNQQGIQVGYLMEYIPGLSAHKIFQNKKGSPEMIAEIKKQVGEQLRILHNAGKVHGDIRPANIMVERLPNGDLKVRLIDFSSAIGEMYKDTFAHDDIEFADLERKLRNLMIGKY